MFFYQTSPHTCNKSKCLDTKGTYYLTIDTYKNQGGWGGRVQKSYFGTDTEILASAHGREEIFDSHVPNKKHDFEKPFEKRTKRQVDQEDARDALCQDKNAGEFFRLVAGQNQCRDVVSCTDGGLQAIRCPPGFAFDLSKQTCELKQLV